MREQLERLRGLLEEFRLFLSPIALKVETLDPAPLIEAAVAHTAGARARRRATLEYAAEPDLPRVSVDAVLFERAAQLLLSEALNRSQEGSPMGLEVRVEAGGAWLRVAVRHAGKPVPDGRLTASWEPFAVRYGAGSGLGLAIVRRIAEAHGGGVLSESLGSGGACYGLRLPVARTARG
jgi:signal transduction histidine kinase